MLREALIIRSRSADPARLLGNRRSLRSASLVGRFPPPDVASGAILISSLLFPSNRGSSLRETHRIKLPRWSSSAACPAAPAAHANGHVAASPTVRWRSNGLVWPTSQGRPNQR